MLALSFMRKLKNRKERTVVSKKVCDEEQDLVKQHDREEQPRSQRLLS